MIEPTHERRGSGADVLESWNGEAVDARAVPVLPVAHFRSIVVRVVQVTLQLIQQVRLLFL